MAQKKHILICGDRGAGKSTLIEKLLSRNCLPVYGFFTRNTPRPDGAHDIYIYRTGDLERTQSKENYIDWCDSKKRSFNPYVFDTLGTEYLKAGQDGIIVMDEIGFMETASKPFCDAVMRHLDGDIPILATVKGRFDIPFLDRVREHPNAALYTITEENRDELYETLLSVILKWNRERGKNA